ncbi:carboxypeptidase-like regulatory domain-containing protein [Salinimicrobium sp. CDJ15-81-2]|nr:carboxypeptidase-like regulatory domain-containing protein [Salinimicrobium nanhaiense]
MQERYLLFFFGFLPFIAASQITGSVYSAKDSVALQGVSVYFDGTSLGTVSDSQGNFRLENSAATVPLVISYLGYKHVLIKDLQKGQILRPIYLEEATEQLAAVFIEPDTWSREKKLQVFKREFFGYTAEAAKCRIKNPEVLELRYSPSRKILTAYSREPLQIINRHLGYEITYSLDSFEALYDQGNSGLTYVQMVTYQGTSFFRNLHDTPGKKYLKNRRISYHGSSLHFMRALAKKQLEENGFEIYFDRFKTAPYKHFKIEQDEELTAIELLAEKISILYSGILQSGLQATSPFHIDHLGNNNPPLAVLFSGEMSEQRIAHLLPLDYWP